MLCLMRHYFALLTIIAALFFATSIYADDSVAMLRMLLMPLMTLYADASRRFFSSRYDYLLDGAVAMPLIHYAAAI